LLGSDLQIELLGGFSITHNGRALGFPSGRTRLLLVYLLLHPGPIPRSRLADVFWPDSGEEQARTNLRRELHNLKRHLPLSDRILEVTSKTIGLASDAPLSVTLDGVQELLPEEDAEWLLPIRQRLQDERAHRLELDINSAETAGDFARALAGLRELLTLDPLREDLHRQKMRLLFARGDRSGAMLAYDDCIAVLDQELGIEPSPPTRRLHEQLLLSNEESHRPTTEEQNLPPMLGRQREWSRVSNWLEAGCVESHYPLLLITGEPGIGKSRLLQELQNTVAHRGGSARRGRSYEAERHQPFGVWQEVIPNLAQLLEQNSQRGDRASQFEALLRPLQVGSLQPVVLLLDDIQWIDEASAAMLHYAYRQSPLLLACAARSAELEENPHAQALLRTLQRERNLQRVHLGPLDTESILELAPEADPVRCGGNPLLALELARADLDGDQSELQELVHGRLSRLTSLSRELLSWSAVLGRDFSASKLGMVSGRSLLEMIPALEELERHQVFCPRGDNYDFAHDLIREAVYDRLSRPRRRLLHLQIAQALDLKAHPGEVAHHARQAGETLLGAKASLWASRDYLKVLAFHEAFRLAEDGLRLTESLAEEWELKLDLFSVLITAGIPETEHLTKRDQLKAIVKELAELELDGLRARATSLISMWDFDRQNLDSVQEHSLQSAEVAHMAKPGDAARMLAHSAACFVSIGREIPKARALLQEATRLAELAQVNPVELHLTRGVLARFDGRSEEARDSLSGTLKLAAKRKDLWRSIIGLTHLAMLNLEEGRDAEVIPLCEQLQDISTRLGPGSEGPVAKTLRALAQRDHDQLSLGLQELREADNKRMLAYCLRQAALLMGRTDLLESAYEAARNLDKSEEVLSQVALAHLLLDAGQRQQAREKFLAVRKESELGLSQEAKEARQRLGRKWTR
jgi:DNA-binding SARP family transcriptional activator